MKGLVSILTFKVVFEKKTQLTQIKVMHTQTHTHFLGLFYFDAFLQNSSQKKLL